MAGELVAYKIAEELEKTLPACYIQSWNNGPSEHRVLIPYSATAEDGMRGKTFYEELKKNLPHLKPVVPHVQHMDLEQP
eukprot:12317295-Karenia_brevis.AAC.1